MNITLLAPACKVYDIVDMESDDEEQNKKITWKNCSFLYNGEVMTLTLDKSCYEKVVPNKIYQFAIQIRENNVVSRNGKSVYKTYKFKITDASEIQKK